MKSVLLIGMGKFGQTIGQILLSMGDDVTAVDRREEIINAIAPRYSDAMIANCTDINALSTLDIPSFDACIVAIGDDFQSSLEISSLLKELGAKHVISRATTEIQRKFLLRNGADEVIYPDRDIAEKLAVKLNASRVYDYVELSNDYAVFELAVPAEWAGRTLQEINPRRKYDINILTIKQSDEEVFVPAAQYRFSEGDHMIVFGNIQKTLAFTNRSPRR